MLLSNLKAGESCVVLNLNNPEKVKNRLNELGIVKGIKLTLIRKAPFSDPIEIFVRGYCLAIRKIDADGIEVRLL